MSAVENPAELLRELFRATVSRLDPAALVEEACSELPAGSVFALSLGKAAPAMARGAARALGDRLHGGVAVARERVEVPERFELFVGSHPTPDACSEAAGQAVLDAACACECDRLLVMVSGGASALAALPAEGIDIHDKAAALDAVKRGGAPIRAINAVRKHLSAIKGGQLAQSASRPVSTLVLSDVVGDDLSAVGSGPTVPDPTTFADALAAVDAYASRAELPDSVRHRLEEGERGHVPETPKQGRPGDDARLVAGIGRLVDRMCAVAGERGLHAGVVSRDMDAGVDQVAEQALRWIEQAETRRPLLLVAGGEPVIELSGRPGEGGRAQHLALLLARELRDRHDVTVLVAGSDGEDGSPDAAGAVIDGATWSAIDRAGGNPGSALERFDSGPVLASAGARIVTGPTGVNHADLLAILLT